MFLVLKLNQNVPLKSKRSCLIRYNREEMHPTKISNILLHKQAIIMDFQLNWKSKKIPDPGVATKADCDPLFQTEAF